MEQHIAYVPTLAKDCPVFIGNVAEKFGLLNWRLFLLVIV